MFMTMRDASTPGRAFFKAGPCHFRPELGKSSNPEAALVPTLQMLHNAMSLCAAAPSIEMRYLCGSGMYMTYWTSLFLQGRFDKDFDFVGTCAGMPWPATCYRWTFRYASAAQVSRFRDDPCQTARLTKEGKLKQLRGCLWGVVTQWFRPVWSGNGKLADFCFQQLRISGDSNTWLSCVAAAIEYVSYDDTPVLSGLVVFCKSVSAQVKQQLGHKFPGLGKRTEEICIHIAEESRRRMLFRKYANETSGLLPFPCKHRIDLCLHGWRTDLLE